MPPKKDDKKGKGAIVAVKDVDPAWYIRKTTPLPEPNAEKQLPIPKITGKIINVEKLFSVWSDEENWSEPISSEKVAEIKYPTSLKIDRTTTISAYYELDVPDPSIPVDPKAKKDPKKDTKKKKDANEDVELVEIAVNENGRQLPCIYSNIIKHNTQEFLQYPHLKGFLSETKEIVPEEVNDPVIPIDPIICQVFQLIAQLGYNITSYSNHEIAKEQFDANYLWKAIYPKAKGTNKPVYNPTGKYAVKLFISNAWRKVYVDDNIPLLTNGQPAIAYSTEKYELWPLLLSKAIYTVYSHSGYTFANDIMDHTANNYDVFNSSKVIQFLSFATHLLTGWLPHQTLPMNLFFTQEKTKSIKLLTHMLTSGIPQIDMEDILPEECPYHFNKKEEIVRYVIPDPPLVPVETIDPTSTTTEKGNKDKGGKGGKGGKEEVKKVGNKTATNKVEEIIPEVVVTPSPEEHQEPPPIPQEEVVEAGEGEDNLVKKTKKRFKQDYLAKKATRDEIVAFIGQREEQIRCISTRLSTSITSPECYMIVYYDHHMQSYQSWPILAISLPDSNDNKPSLTNILDIKLLLQWKPYSPSIITPNTTDPIVLGQYKLPIPEFLEPYPLSTPVDYQWKSIQELIDAEAYFVAMFYTFDFPHAASWYHQWTPVVSDIPVVETGKNAKGGGKAGGKDSKGKDNTNAAGVSTEDVLCQAPGVAPVMFLSLDPSSLFDMLEKELGTSARQQVVGLDETSGSEVLLMGGENDATAGGTAVEDEEIQEALQLQLQAQLEQESIQTFTSSHSVPTLSLEGGASIASLQSSSATLLPNVANLNLKLMITLVADLIKPNENDAHEKNAEEENVIALESPSGALAKKGFFNKNNNNSAWDLNASMQFDKKPKTLPSNTVIMLQEIQFDTSIEPLVFVMKLNDDVTIPIVTKVFTIPFDKLHLETRSEPLIFWVRVFTNTSLSFHCHANVPIVMDKAESLWSMIGQGTNTTLSTWSALSYEGESEVTVDNMEQILFRIPLLTTSTTTTANNTTEEIEEESIDASTSLYTPIEGPQAMAFVYIAEDNVDRLCELYAITTKDDKCLHIDELSHIRGQLVVLSNTKQSMEWLMGLIHTSSDLQIPKFKWKVILISKSTMLEILPNHSLLPSLPPTARYTGHYIPNKSLCLFRDVISIEKTSFPMAFKFTVRSAFPSDQYEYFEENIAFSIRFYRKSDMKLIAEYHGCDVLHCYHQDMTHFLIGGATAGDAISRPITGNKDAKKATPAAPAKGKGGKEVVPVVDSIEVIMEGVLDEEHMQIPPTWRSRFPHQFDELYTTTATTVATVGDEAILSEAQLAMEERLKLQQTYLTLQPKATPMIRWELDMLAGKVTSISHDITQLMKFQEVKKTWWGEEHGNSNSNSHHTSGRAEKAIAAGNYMKEYIPALIQTKQEKYEIIQKNKILHLDHLEHPWEPLEEEALPSIPLTASMTEALVLALASDQEQLNKRFTILHEAYDNEEKVEVIKIKREQSIINPNNYADEEETTPSSSSTTAATAAFPPMGSVAWDTMVKEKVEESREQIESSYQQLTITSSQLLESYRDHCKSRILQLTEQYRIQRNTLIGIFTERERYRQEIENKNKSLTILLKRSKDAKQNAKDKEAAIEAERLKQEAKMMKGKKK